MNAFVVGIAAKNEENSIYNCLESIKNSLKNINAEWEIIISLNSCTDSTESEIEKFIYNTRTNITLVKSSGNLIDAQRQIHRFAKGRRIVFIDADTIVDGNLIKNLLSGIRNEVVLTYAESELTIKPTNLVSKIYSLYNSQKMLTKRYYFHGRCFATDIWHFPPQRTIREKAKNALYLYKYGGDLAVDDIYLSAYILKNYGQNSIQSVKTSKVSVKPITTWKDWWITYRRTRIEVMKIVSWFDEFNEIESLLYRNTNWSQWKSSTNTEKSYWIIYLIFKRVSEALVNFELFRVRTLHKSPPEQWKPSLSTKIIYNNSIIVLDIDRTLIEDGEKYYLDKKIQAKIKSLMKKGIIIGIATHRSYEGSISIYQRLKLNGPLLVEGGALIFENNNGVMTPVDVFSDKSSVLPIVEKLVSDYAKFSKKILL